MTYPITPNPAIHNVPPQIQAQNNAMTQEQLKALGQNLLETIYKALVQLFLGGVAMGQGVNAGTWATALSNWAQQLYSVATQSFTQLTVLVNEIVGDVDTDIYTFIAWLQGVQGDVNEVIDSFAPGGTVEEFQTGVTNLLALFGLTPADVGGATVIDTVWTDVINTIINPLNALEVFADKIIGQIEQSAVTSSTGLANLEGDINAIFGPFQNITDLTSPTAWSNAWRGLEGLLGVPIVGPDDVQTISQTTSGTQTVSFNGQAATSTIANGDSAATVQTALSTITALSDNISVSGSGPWSVTFINALGGTTQPLMTSTGTGVTIAHTTPTGGLSEGAPTQIHPGQVAAVLGYGDLGTDLTQMATQLFGSPTVNAITTVEQDIANFISNALSGGSAETSTNSPVQFLEGMLGLIPHTNVVIPPSPGTGVITHDANAHNFWTGTNNYVDLTFNHTVGASANYLAIRLGYFAFEPVIISVTYDGISVPTLVSEATDSNDINLLICGLANPPAGTHQVSVTLYCPGGNAINCIVAESDSYIGVGSVSSTAAVPGTGSSLSATVPSGSGDYILQGFFAVSPESLTLSSYNQTTQYNSGDIALGSQNFVLLAGDAAGASSVSFTATASNIYAVWASAAVNLIPLPSTVLGSVFRAANTSTTTVSAASGNNLFVNGFFGTQVTASADLTYAPSSFSEVTIEHAGTYSVTIAVLMVSTFNNQFLGLNLIQNGSSVKRGNTVLVSNPSFNTNVVVSHTFQVYCSAGDTLQPGYYSSASGSAFTGTADGLSTYFEVSLNNRGLHS